LLFVIGGVVGSLAVLGLMIGLGMLFSSATGQNTIKVAVYPAALPLAFSFAGWLELLSGLRFTQLSESFDKAQGVTKSAMIFSVLVAVVGFLALMIWLWFRVNEWVFD
jgi:hypothetical protein